MIYEGNTSLVGSWIMCQCLRDEDDRPRSTRALIPWCILDYMKEDSNPRCLHKAQRFYVGLDEGDLPRSTRALILFEGSEGTENKNKNSSNMIFGNTKKSYLTQMPSVGFEPTVSSAMSILSDGTKMINHDPRGHFFPCCIVDYMSVKINFKVGPRNCNWYIGWICGKIKDPPQNKTKQNQKAQLKRSALGRNRTYDVFINCGTCLPLDEHDLPLIYGGDDLPCSIMVLSYVMEV
ncbi:hypothetical protein B0H13DRAFT_1874714 [Mycena leptocephala]|nr:hypothetical protein B0H13DRAFT_1874714 [Mycena leptocephala]